MSEQKGLAPDQAVDPLDELCNACGAAPGVPCRGVGYGSEIPGKPLAHFHPNRVRKAVRRINRAKRKAAQTTADQDKPEQRGI